MANVFILVDVRDDGRRRRERRAARCTIVATYHSFIKRARLAKGASATLIN